MPAEKRPWKAKRRSERSPCSRPRTSAQRITSPTWLPSSWSIRFTSLQQALGPLNLLEQLIKRYIYIYIISIYTSNTLKAHHLTHLHTETPLNSFEKAQSLTRVTLKSVIQPSPRLTQLLSRKAARLSCDSAKGHRILRFLIESYRSMISN